MSKDEPGLLLRSSCLIANYSQSLDWDHPPQDVAVYGLAGGTTPFAKTQHLASR